MTDTESPSVDASAVIDEYSRRLTRSQHEIVLLTVQLQDARGRLSALESASAA